MATLRQIESNRRNAAKSTGPRTAEGKAVARFNALKTGIYGLEQVIRGEDPRTLDELAASYHGRFRPATPEARALVDSLVTSEWLLRRLRKAEAQYWNYQMESVVDPNPPFPIGKALSYGGQAFSRIQRRIDSAERNFHRALKELQRDAAQPSTSAIPPAAPVEITLAPEPPASAIGFVPSPRASVPPASCTASSTSPVCFESASSQVPGHTNDSVSF